MSGGGFQGCHVIEAHWSNPSVLPSLHALTTTRHTPVDELSAPRPWPWLNQVHGTRVIHVDDWQPSIEADGAWTDKNAQVAIVKTADCLPLLMASHRPAMVAAIHAGWRGLAGGMIDRAIEALPSAPEDLQVWVGPSISQQAYEVDEPVLASFLAHHRALEPYFGASRPGHWRVDLPGMATELLHRAGVMQVTVSGLCTAGDPGRFYSYRRGLSEGEEMGRMASLIWLA